MAPYSWVWSNTQGKNHEYGYILRLKSRVWIYTQVKISRLHREPSISILHVSTSATIKTLAQTISFSPTPSMVHNWQGLNISRMFMMTCIMNMIMTLKKIYLFQLHPLILIRLIPILKTQTTLLPCHYLLLNHLHFFIANLYMSHHPLQLLFHLLLQPYHLNAIIFFLNNHPLMLILNVLDMISPHLYLHLPHKYSKRSNYTLHYLLTHLIILLPLIML